MKPRKPKPDPTAAERRRRYDERSAQDGIVMVQVKVPVYRRAELLKLVAKWRDKHRGDVKD